MRKTGAEDFCMKYKYNICIFYVILSIVFIVIGPYLKYNICAINNNAIIPELVVHLK